MQEIKDRVNYDVSNINMSTYLVELSVAYVVIVATNNILCDI